MNTIEALTILDARYKARGGRLRRKVLQRFIDALITDTRPAIQARAMAFANLITRKESSQC